MAATAAGAGPPTTTAINFRALGSRLHSSFNDPYRRRSPLLLILDLHGVLVQRLGHKDDKALKKRTAQQRPPWTRFNKHDIWLRPYLHQFLSIGTARHHLSIWSAAQPQNVRQSINLISNQIDLPLSNRLAFIYDRKLCRPDPTSGKYQVVKYLPDLWERDQRFNQTNTLIVDDTFSKIRFQCNSAIVIPEYSVNNYPETYNNDDSLLWMLLYLEYLIEVSGIEQYHQYPPHVYGIANIRHMVPSFENFWSLGFQQACEISTHEQRQQYDSLAYVFFPQQLIDEATRYEQQHMNQRVVEVVGKN